VLIKVKPLKIKVWTQDGENFNPDYGKKVISNQALLKGSIRLSPKN
jgi:hypothetical protein